MGRAGWLVIGIAAASAWAGPGRAAEPWKGSSAPALELESQVPCLFLGGYQLAAGLRGDRLRVRASVIDSGRFDLEPFGFDGQPSRFRRTLDDGSFGLSADWFVTSGWYVGVLAASHRWAVESKRGGTRAHLRTFDTGLGTGYQWLFWRGVFLQPVLHLFVRDRRTTSVFGERYRIPAADWNAAIRLGVRL